MPRDNDFSVLEKFGLTSYEIKLYVTLLENGPMTATAAAAKSSVPQPRIYDTFKNLAEKGFVEMSLDRRRLYKAVDPDVIITQKIDEITKSGAIAKKELKKVLENGSQDNVPSLWVFRRSGAFAEHLGTLIDSSTTEIVLALKKDLIHQLEPRLMNARSRGVVIAVTVYSDEREDASHYDGVFRDIFVKSTNPGSIEMCLTDQKKGIIRVPRSADSQEYSLLVEESEIAHILGFYFYNSIWQRSEYVVIPVQLKEFSFSSIWFACEAAKLFMERGHSLMAYFKGIRDGHRVNVEGPVDHVDIQPGIRNTVYVNTRDGIVSVGGKNMVFEDVLMLESRLVVTD